MPWKANSVLEERLRFVGRLLDGEAMTDPCREFGISRRFTNRVAGGNKIRRPALLSRCPPKPKKLSGTTSGLPQRTQMHGRRSLTIRKNFIAAFEISCCT
jgi:hypothetical protein